jgi:single-stranded-DNA-specific exonuclease
MNKRWVHKEQSVLEDVRDLAQQLNIENSLSNLLIQRGITSFDEAKIFFRPQLKQLHSPFLMKGMDKAITRIEKALANNEKILIYGDYDVDGTTAVALVYTYIHSFYDQLDFYVPDRYSEGYGVSYQAIDFAKENNFTLVIALDCGIKAVEKIKYASERNIDFIICDHHRPGNIIPVACAVLDPKQDDCNYPFKELSGCGLGFKLAQAFEERNNVSSIDLNSLLDLVAVSIASDIVPVTGENRILAHYGLKLINTNPRAGIEAILKYSNINRKTPAANGFIFSKELSISDLVFLVGPRINAAGRIESAKDSVKILITSSFEYASRKGEQINELNTERKNLDALATEQALEMINTSVELQKRKSTVVYNPEWHKGVIGIVASRLTEHYYRPTIVFTKSNGLLTGSARSVKNFDVYDAVDSCSEYLEHFGGHMYAAGLSIKPENFENFSNKFEKYVSTHIKEEMMIPEIEIDSQLNLNKINAKFFRILKQFAPFGPENMAPVFMAKRVIDTGFVRIVGSNHLKLNVIHPDISGLPFPAIAFQQSEHYEHIKNGGLFDMSYHLEENEWNGKVSLQLNIKDIIPI